jgi:hypothetical protein
MVYHSTLTLQVVQGFVKGWARALVRGRGFQEWPDSGTCWESGKDRAQSLGMIGRATVVRDSCVY